MPKRIARNCQEFRVQANSKGQKAPWPRTSPATVPRSGTIVVPWS